MLPKVILHTAVSLDGRLDNFAPDVGLFLPVSFPVEGKRDSGGKRNDFKCTHQHPG